MIEIVLVIMLLLMGGVNIYLLKRVLTKKDEPLSEKEKEYRRDISDHMDALLNYTPEIAYKVVKHG